MADGLAGALRGGVHTGTGAWVAAAAAKAPPGVNWGQLLATAGIWAGIVGAVAAVIAIVPMTRNAVLGAWRAALMGAGLPYNRYARKFVEKYGSYDNPYLRVREKRDLRTTFVPLSFQSDEAQGVALATEVLADLPADRLVIIGDPGSGKSTLLRAYGVGVSESRFTIGRRKRVVPYLVPLRDLTAFLGDGRGVAEFITDKILNGYGVFKKDRAAEFFVRTLERQQAIVMLDGLDEVPDDRQQEVLAAVIAFMSAGRPECPTEKARVVLTCRTQNFELLRENWTAALGAGDAIFTLAPLRDSEIVSYLMKFKNLFKTADGPARFIRSVRASKTLDLLRAPLILAIAVGLYADRPTMIPSTVSELYRRMIEELLDRHAFRHERRPDESLLRYRRNDKYQLLREFALHAAQASENFDDFTLAELESFAVTLAPTLDDVTDGKAMVVELIRHSGLISDAGHDGMWHYAHRSIQEFLAAEELQGRNGDAVLLRKADDLNWRQAVQFYTAGREARKVDDFLRQLAKLNSELAAHCLQAARPSDEAGRAVLDALEPVTGPTLSALAAASRSPRVSIRTMAVERLANAIAHSADALTASSASAEDLLPLLETIADADAAEIAALVPRIIRRLPDDPRLVAPLWHCLSADGIALRGTECGEIVRRLLGMVTEADAFDELERQDPNDEEFLSGCRATAYPFRNGLGEGHNLVTLLAWAEYLGVTPPDGNRFLRAKDAGYLARVERDRARTIPLPLCVAARVLASLELLAATVTAGIVLATRPGLLLQPFHNWTLALIIGVGLTPVLLALVHTISLDGYVDRWFQAGWSHESGNPILALLDGYLPDITDLLASGYGLGFLATIGVAFMFAVAMLPLATGSLALYIPAAIIAQLAFWETDIGLFDGYDHHYLYRPNEYVDMYDEASSRRWLVRAAGPGLKLRDERGRVGGPG